MPPFKGQNLVVVMGKGPFSGDTVPSTPPSSSSARDSFSARKDETTSQKMIHMAAKLLPKVSPAGFAQVAASIAAGTFSLTSPEAKKAHASPASGRKRATPESSPPAKKAKETKETKETPPKETKETPPSSQKAKQREPLILRDGAPQRIRGHVNRAPEFTRVDYEILTSDLVAYRNNKKKMRDVPFIRIKNISFKKPGKPQSICTEAFGIRDGVGKRGGQVVKGSVMDTWMVKFSTIREFLKKREIDPLNSKAGLDAALLVDEEVWDLPDGKQEVKKLIGGDKPPKSVKSPTVDTYVKNKLRK